MKKSMLISLALVLTLAVCGFTYALWGGTMFINGTVGTGNYDVECFIKSTNDPGDSIDPGKTMNVGVTQTGMVDPDGNGISDTFTITVDNAYPGYESTSTFCVHNRGSIPAKILGVNVTNDNAADVLGVSTDPDIAGVVLAPGEYRFINVTNVVGDNAAQNATYTYSVQIPTQQAQ